MQTNQIIIINKLGLHARAASKFAQTCTRFSSEIKVGYKGKLVDGKSVMALMLLAAGKGCELELQARGKDEVAALEAISKLIENRFDEQE
ncbi:MAG: HPr family phosphocarrier protein [Gammaproteobacteria bacterium]|nr:HPr family phosphocarrier protein [Gammaproteobacteria bacterium]